MAPRAAWRLESFGFERVFHYAAGKADWAAAGLPLEGREAALPTTGSLARRDVPTCSPDERVGAVRERVRRAGWDTCIVVNGVGIVFGRLQGKALAAGPDAVVEEVMQCGPSTFRPDVPAPEMKEYMDKHRLKSALITTSDGRLVGLVYRQDVEQAS